MKNIAILVQEYYPSDVRVRKEVNALLESGHVIDLFCLKGANEPSNESLGRLRIFRTDISKKRGSKFRYIFEYFIFFIRSYFWLRKITRSRKIDVVHVHTLPDFLVFAAHPAKKRGAKVILDMHEITPEFFMSKYSISENNSIIKLLKYVEKKSIGYSDYVITVNNRIKKIFSERARAKNEIEVIMNTVNDSELPLHPKQKQTKVTGMYHGTLTELYNLSFAIRAIKKIENQLNNFEFHIYGDGKQLNELRYITAGLNLQKIIFIHGKINHGQIPLALSKADIGILPVRKDVMTDLSFSNKLSEYIHCGIPVLSSDLETVKDYFSADSIYYYENNNEADFCQKLLNIISDNAGRKLTSDKALEIYNNINWNVMKHRLHGIYNRI